MMPRHAIRTIDQLGRPLHPAEVLIVSALLRKSRSVRMCTCGTILTGDTDAELADDIADHLGLERVR